MWDPALAGSAEINHEHNWPDAYRANRWVRHEREDPDAETALDNFKRFPRWMWRNRDVVDVPAAADRARYRYSCFEHFDEDSQAACCDRVRTTWSPSSWNLRDMHMMETLEALLAHVRRDRTKGRAVVKPEV
jgi:erythromycin esterase-like protein